MRTDENVTQRQHALQSGLLAEQEWGPDSHEMITASLLHDIGHLLLDEHAGDESFLQEVGPRAPSSNRVSACYS